MSLGEGDLAFALELFEPLGGVTHRKMFGGAGLYRDNLIFALVASDGRIYLKAIGEMAQHLADEGSQQFHNMPYWSVPDHALDQAEVACDLARRTMANLQG